MHHGHPFHLSGGVHGPKLALVPDLNHPQTVAVLEHVAAVTGLWARRAALDSNNAPPPPPDSGLYVRVLDELERVGLSFPHLRALEHRPYLRNGNLALVALCGQSQSA